MCGIAAIISFKSDVAEQELKALCDRMTQRGPDDYGYWLEGGIALGHRRLSIIDLETGHQPMLDPQERVVLVFNGEIYNYQELRAELVELGCPFRTKSDTEIILQGYLKYGMMALLPRLEGMFAFVLHDRHTGETWVARDKFGEKPLYYTQQGPSLWLASELKAIAPGIADKSIDKTALNQFLSLTYIPAPRTIWNEVKKLRPAHVLHLQKTGQVTETAYYDLVQAIRAKPAYTSMAQAQKDLEALLFKAVEQRMVADVPLGAFLSGGLDSSIVSAIMARLSPTPVHTFSIGFLEKEYDESERAQWVADHIAADHTVRFLDYQDVVGATDDIVAYFDEPFGDSSALPSFYVAKLAREKVTVVLTGDCADELFGGYEKYLGAWYAQRFQALPKWLQAAFKRTVALIPHTPLTNSLLRRIKKVTDSSHLSGFESHYRYMCLGFHDEGRAQVLQTGWHTDFKAEIQQRYEDLAPANDLEKGFYTDVCTVLEGDMLVKVDRMAMKNSLEARVPFLDSRIVEAAFAMPSEYKINGREKKYILKKTFSHLLPQQTPNLRKKGFGVPVDYWFRHQLKPELTRLLNRDRLAAQGIFNPDEVERLLEQHWSGKHNHKGKIWNLLVFQKWYEHNVEPIG